jgi:hypothetical protein
MLYSVHYTATTSYGDKTDRLTPLPSSLTYSAEQCQPPHDVRPGHGRLQERYKQCNRLGGLVETYGGSLA